MIHGGYRNSPGIWALLLWSARAWLSVQRDLLRMAALGIVVVAATGAVAWFMPTQPISRDQDKILRQIAKVTDAATYDSKVARMAFKSGDRSMGCHYGWRAIGVGDEIDRLMAMLPPDDRSKVADIELFKARRAEAAATISSICPPAP